MIGRQAVGAVSQSFLCHSDILRGKEKMGVIVREDRLFILNTRNTSYAFFRDDDGILVQLYWGK